MERIEIPLKKSRVWLVLIILSIVLAGISYFAINTFSSILDWYDWATFLFWCIALLSVILLLVPWVKKVIIPKPGLVISVEGFYDNTGVVSWGLIKWQDVWHVSDAGSDNLIYISLHNRNFYASRLNPISAIFTSGTDSWGEPIGPIIDIRFLDSDNIEPQAAIRYALEKYKTYMPN